MDNRKVLCVGDSLGLPREGVKFEHTWYYKLIQGFPEFLFIPQFFRGLTTNYLVNSIKDDFLENYLPYKVILQVGIVDCSPRYLRQNSNWNKLLATIPKFVSSYIWKLIKKHGKRKPECADVLPAKFEANLRNYFNRCINLGVAQVIIIKISQPSQNMIIRNPGITEQVALYNSIFDRLSKEYSFISLVDPLKLGNNDYFLEDGYHLNANGNQMVYQFLSEFLTQTKDPGIPAMNG